MEVATYILFSLGVLGGADILLFHSISHGIRSHHDSRFELLVHSLRGPTYAALFVVIPNFEMHGAYFWLLISIFAFDIGVSIVDFMIERASRAFFGGLPSGEYVLHGIMAMLFGALVTSVFYGAGVWSGMPTALTYAPAAVHDIVRAVMVVMAISVLWSGTMDLIAALKLSKETEHDHA